MPPTVSAERISFDSSLPWALSPRVSVRPEPFGALLYNFGTRQLSFLKDRRLVGVVQSLEDYPDARSACRAHQVSEAELPQFDAALARLAAGAMLVSRTASPTASPTTEETS
jgi:putative mycofactocin binding protein MftB